MAFVFCMHVRMWPTFMLKASRDRFIVANRFFMLIHTWGVEFCCFLCFVCVWMCLSNDPSQVFEDIKPNYHSPSFVLSHQFNAMNRRETREQGHMIIHSRTWAYLHCSTLGMCINRSVCLCTKVMHTLAHISTHTHTLTHTHTHTHTHTPTHTHTHSLTHSYS